MVGCSYVSLGRHLISQLQSTTILVSSTKLYWLKHMRINNLSAVAAQKWNYH